MFSERDLVRKPDMRRVNIPISLDMAFEALANLAGDSGGAPVATELSKASWCAGIFSCVGWRRHGPCEAGKGCSNVTPFAAGTCRSMGRSGLSSMLVPGSGTAVLLPLAIVEVCAGGAAPVSGINCVSRDPCCLRCGAAGSGAGSRRVTTCRRHYWSTGFAPGG